MPEAWTDLVLTGRVTPSWSVLPWTCKDMSQAAVRGVILKSYPPARGRVTSLGITYTSGLTDRS